LIGYFGKSVVGLLLGVLCVFLSGVIPFLLLPATLPPKLAYTIFVVSEFVLNFVFIVFITSYLRTDAAKGRHMQILLRKTLLAFLPAVVMACVAGAIVTWKYVSSRVLGARCVMTTCFVLMDDVRVFVLQALSQVDVPSGQDHLRGADRVRHAALPGQHLQATRGAIATQPSHVTTQV
jgi:hypothetical protein